MSGIPSLLRPGSLVSLRASYTPADMVSANVEGMAQKVSAFEGWNAEIGRTFYGNQGLLAAVDRERCLIALLTSAGLPLPLAVHVYWGLMEGLNVAEICQVVGLSGCYAGLPKCVQGLLVVERAVRLLDRVGQNDARDARSVLRELLKEFGSGV